MQRTGKDTPMTTAIQGSLLPIDIEEVWAEFLETSRWRTTDQQAEVQHLQSRLARLRDREAEIVRQIESVEGQIDSISHREELAKQHMIDVAKALGPFATRHVLLAAVREKFPPSPRWMDSGADQEEADKLPAPTAAWEPTYEQVEAVFSVLDGEGMRMGEVIKALKSGEHGNLTSRHVSIILKRLQREQRVDRRGERRATEYFIVSGHGA